ncbi:glycosyltransferase [Alkalihalobacillus trypoxylicola]|uniref:Uncharacterized protein n=1 Tax=Alkalihalobacillus trypoxylicola TaxID=519424 RepID=A0A162ETT0_9BACI|nr:glycosyltransferase [Alkalihalobacillus trypoxylicola]KYG33708.1 hypothetical protein AZF04_15905 [Alkalihalobacillus trypoxylicola]
MMESSKMHIITAVDDHYAQHLGVMLTSLFENLKKDTSVQLYIIDGGIQDNNSSKLKSLLGRFKVDVKYVKVNKEILNDFFIDKHLSVATYYKALIPLLLEKDINKVIYLDSDIIIKDDLYKLWETNVSSTFLCAVDNSNLQRNADLNMPATANYFNAGVMIINVQKWRENHIVSNVLDFISYHKEGLKFHDQDALNVVLMGKWEALHPKWNYRESYKSITAETSKDSILEIHEAIKYPSIIHFTDASKPWHYLNNHPYKGDYLYYLSKTPWSDYAYPKQHEIEEYFTSKKVIIFGTGKSSEETASLLESKNYRIAYFLDNNPQKWGQDLGKTTIQKPETLINEQKESIFIIIASMYYTEISSQLESMGFKRNIHFVVKGFENELGND